MYMVRWLSRHGNLSRASQTWDDNPLSVSYPYRYHGQIRPFEEKCRVSNIYTIGVVRHYIVTRTLAIPFPSALYRVKYKSPPTAS